MDKTTGSKGGQLKLSCSQGVQNVTDALESGVFFFFIN